MPPPLVALTHLTKTYAGRKVVDDLCLTVPEGAVAVILGPNGAGKSTTLEIVATLRPPTSGSVELAGLDVVQRRAEARRVLGYVPQANALDPLMTTRETLTFHRRALGLTGRDGTTRAERAIGLLGLGPSLDKRVSGLSGGTRRRVDLALALLGSPRLLILDEPTTGLDPATRLDLWAELRRLVADGLTLLLSTQDLHEAEALASHLVVLRAGALVAAGTPGELKRAVGTRTLRIDAVDDDGASAIAERLAARHSREGTRVLVPLGDQADEQATSWPVAIGELGPVAGAIAGLAVDEPTLDDVFAAFAGVPTANRTARPLNDRAPGAHADTTTGGRAA